MPITGWFSASAMAVLLSATLFHPGEPLAAKVTTTDRPAHVGGLTPALAFG